MSRDHVRSSLKGKPTVTWPPRSETTPHAANRHPAAVPSGCNQNPILVNTRTTCTGITGGGAQGNAARNPPESRALVREVFRSLAIPPNSHTARSSVPGEQGQKSAGRGHPDPAEPRKGGRPWGHGARCTEQGHWREGPRYKRSLTKFMVSKTCTSPMVALPGYAK